MHDSAEPENGPCGGTVGVAGGGQVWLVAADCFFIGLAPVLVHMAKNKDGKYNFHPVAINLLVEVAKLVFATGTLLVNVRSHNPLPPPVHTLMLGTAPMKYQCPALANCDVSPAERNDRRHSQ